jgi:hypothetical protein
MLGRARFFLALAASLFSVAARADDRPWLKGQTHVHSNNSGDSKTPPADVVRWYAARGYDFIVFTDHNFITNVPGTDKMLVLPGVELTLNLPTCDPPPEDDAGCLLHMNVLGVTPTSDGKIPLRPATSGSREELFQRELKVAANLNGLPQLNHPNFHYSADAQLIAKVAGNTPFLLEVANMAIDSNNGGDLRHPSTEKIWDQVLSSGAIVWGVASDDAHHYDDADAVRASGKMAFTGDRGWIMVHSRKDPMAILQALGMGDFYATNGVTLTEITVEKGVIELAVAGSRPHHFTFIGKNGKVLAEKDGTRASVSTMLARPSSPRPPDQKGDSPSTILARDGYLRVRVTDGKGHFALTQPIWVQ